MGKRAELEYDSIEDMLSGSLCRLMASWTCQASAPHRLFSNYGKRVPVLPTVPIVGRGNLGGAARF